MPLPFFEFSAQRLDAIVQQGLLCVFDFDGTLAPLVLRPEEARIPVSVLRRVTTLSQYAPIGVISGRAVADLRARLGFEPDFVIGNHGLEGVPETEILGEHCRQVCLEWKATMAVMLELPEAYGVWIEDKGYSLSVHYRMARDPAVIERHLIDALATLSPQARIVAGKYVLNLLPQGACHKGTALEHLMRQCDATSVIYIGDDVTDEDVFQLRRPDVLTVRVGNAGNSAAEFYLSHRLDIEQLLDGLIGRLRQTNAHNWIHAMPLSFNESSPMPMS